MYIFLKIICTLILVIAMAWAFLPGGFGLNNFNKANQGLLTHIASISWWALLLAHPFAAYKLWFGTGNVYWWLLLPLVLHILFFTIFGQDVGTR